MLEKNKFEMRIVIFAFMLLMSACTDPMSAELSALQGRWHLVSEMHQGKPTPEEDIKNGFIIFEPANKWRVEVEGKIVGSGSFKIDPAQSPKTIDYTFSEGDEKGQTFLAIYQVSGGSFRHCGVMNGERPKDFSAEAGSENYLVTFEREK